MSDKTETPPPPAPKLPMCRTCRYVDPVGGVDQFAQCYFCATNRISESFAFVSNRLRRDICSGVHS